jgi:hypothetical protein
MKQQSEQPLESCDSSPDPKSDIQCKTSNGPSQRPMVSGWVPVYVEGMKNGERFCDICYSNSSLTLEGERIHA